MDNLKALYPALHVREPTERHTHTAILLHGRGSNGPEFESELFSAQTPSQPPKNLPSRFPGWRWVFPSSRTIWSTTFQEEMPAWFEAHSLTDITARQELQVDGLRDSVEYLLQILDDEVNLLGGNAKNVVLGGISQGAATGVWTLLCDTTDYAGIGGFFGASTWLPFADRMEMILAANDSTSSSTKEVSPQTKPALKVVDSLLSTIGLAQKSPSEAAIRTMLSAPVFLGHGTDDAYVDVTLGRQARDILLRMGMAVEWREYVGAEEEGHWLKEPEELDDVAAFLEAIERRGTATPARQGAQTG